MVYAEQPLDDSPTASLVGDGMCFRQIEFVGILKAPKIAPMAEKFIDYMLDVPFQGRICPLQMFVYPGESGSQTAGSVFEILTDTGQARGAFAGRDQCRREKWIEAWDEVVLR